MEHPFGLRKGAWTEEEDLLLRKCIQKYGEGKWHQVPLRAGLRRCRKSCRLRWLNYLRPNIKRGEFTPDEVDLIIKLHKLLGNRWSLIAGRLPGRTANDIKNYWNTRLNKNHVYEGEVGKPIVKTGKIKAIKPQPWAFPKKHPLLRRLSASTSKETTTTTITNTTATTTTQSRELLGMESPTLPPEDPWLLWEDVLVRKEEEKGTSCSINASREELIKSLLIDDVETTTKGGETSSKEGKGDWDDFSWIEDIVPMTKEGGEILGDDGKNDWNELFFDYNLWDTL